MRSFFKPLMLLCGGLLFITLTACGGGSSSSSTPTSSATSSTPTASSTVSSPSSQSAVSVTASSSSDNALPSHASNGVIYCTPAGADADGDGWGWEKNATCLVRNSSADPDKGNFQGCVINTGSWHYCSVDNGSWGQESNNICISRSFCPANRDNEQLPISDTLVTPQASATAQQVYNYLRSIWGEKTISGQQDLTWFDDIDMFQRVLDETGKAPALMGYDFMNYSLSNTSGLQQTEEAIEHWQRGGLVTFAWHWRDPSRNTQEFYTDRTAFQIPVASNGALDTNHPVFQQMRDDIDQIAGELKRLQDSGVVVLWRPLHEAAGGWFWWGRARTDDISPAYAQTVLWRYMFDRLTQHHGLKNLIWVWNGQGAAWYPGDNYVDVVSLDIYDGTRNYSSQINAYHQTKAWPLQSKMVALSENSNLPDPDKMAAEGAWWLWFMVWNDSNTPVGVSHPDNFWTGEYYNSNAHKKHVYSHPNIVTLDDLPRFQ